MEIQPLFWNLFFVQVYFPFFYFSSSFLTLLVWFLNFPILCSLSFIHYPFHIELLFYCCYFLFMVNFVILAIKCPFRPKYLLTNNHSNKETVLHYTFWCPWISVHYIVVFIRNSWIAAIFDLLLTWAKVCMYLYWLTL